MNFKINPIEKRNHNHHPQNDVGQFLNSLPNLKHDIKDLDSLLTFLLLKMLEHDIKLMKRELKIMERIKYELEKGNVNILKGSEIKCLMKKD